MNIVEVLKSAVIAGICIGIAGIGFLATRDIIGSVLFAFALLTVVAYKLKLYTGTAGFIQKGELPLLILVFVGNVCGCLLMSLLARLSPMPLQESAQSILEGRLAMGPLHGGLLSIACGFIMTTAVTFARKETTCRCFSVCLFSSPVVIRTVWQMLSSIFVYRLISGWQTWEAFSVSMYALYWEISWDAISIVW